MPSADGVGAAASTHGERAASPAGAGAATVVFQPGGRRVAAVVGESLLRTAQAGGVDLASVCGGVGCCGSCVVRVASGRLSGRTAQEADVLRSRGLGGVDSGDPAADSSDPATDSGDPAGDSGDPAGDLRLACLAQVAEPGRVVVEVPASSRVGDHPSQTEAAGLEVSPGVGRPGVGLGAVGPAGAGAGWPRSERSGAARRLGLAVDLGTTGLAAYLVDLPDGLVLAAAGIPNPQIAFGEDVMSRLTVAITDPDRTRAMRDVLTADVDRLAGELCATAGAGRDDVVQAVVVGNTAMHHLYFGLPVESLAWAPYTPFEAAARTVPADSVGLRLAVGATVTSPPVVAGFVGADHVAMLLAAGAGPAGGAAGPGGAAGVTAYLDVGTNTEISLVIDGAHWSCSAASGPAFEGAHIEAGMRAARGAIDRVWWVGGGLAVSTIDDAPAVGICGSGLLDAVAVLHTRGAISEVGGLVAGHPLVSGSGRSASVELAAAGAGSAGSGRAIRLSRRDVGEVQLAKAAVRAGIRLLTEAAGIDEGDIAEVVLAGAFGTYLDVDSARAIGLIPPVARVRQIGNGAGAGACLLLGGDRWPDAIALAERIDYVELTGHSQFQDRFTRALRLSGDPWSE
jgi:uncharacterized 2Fe-2S/4Fe-4S cluster protein (DUF4445 family)